MIAMRIAAVVVMYHPEKHFLDNIDTYINRVSRLYIIDNSESPDHEMYSLLKRDQKISIIADGVNHGIAKALNIAGEKARHEGFGWLLTMDQDTSFEAETLATYIQAAESYPATGSVAVFGLAYDKGFSDSHAAGQMYAEVNSLITSGSLVNLSLFPKLGGYDEKLFIDEVDHDYCYRAVIAGHKIILVRSGLMQHSLGKTHLVGSQGTAGAKKKTLHHPLRIYYIVRNGLYVYSRYKKRFPKDSSKRWKIIYVTLKNNLRYGQQKTAIIRFAVLGVCHYLTGRFYKL